MDSIDLMVQEHQLIMRMLKVMRNASFQFMEKNTFDDQDFKAMIEFVRQYADAHHHGKEEKLLFNRMVSEIGVVAEKLVTHGMLVEHDLGRLHIRQLEEAIGEYKSGDSMAKLDIIANAISYTHLLTRHIDKEDRVAYTFAKRTLSPKTLIEIDTACEAFEKKQEALGIQVNYQKMVERLEEKYTA